MCFVASAMLGSSFLFVKIISLPWSRMMRKTYYYVTETACLFHLLDADSLSKNQIFFVTKLPEGPLQTVAYVQEILENIPFIA